MAKWVFYILVLVYMCYRAVYGARVIDTGISVEQIDYEEEGFLEVGSRKTVTCKAPNKNYKLDWLDPSGNAVKRIPTSRVYAQEHLVSTPKGNRIPGLVLTFADLQVSDSGVYQCNSGQQKKSVRVCVIKPAEFVESSDTPAEVTIEAGRAITLSCQANGDPEPKLVWTRNDKVLTEGDEENPKYIINKRYKIDGYETLLTITSVGPSDGGQYNCVAMQESVMLENCTAANIKNVTLLVNHVPTFKHGNDIEYVYGITNEIVHITCEAKGYPKPTYRFFKDLGGGSLYEFDKSKIEFSEESNTATLPVTAGPTNFGNTYKCTASNVFGDQDKYFELRRREKPRKPDQVKPVLLAYSRVLLNITWDDEIYFPVDKIRVRYFAGNSIPHDVIKEVADDDEYDELYSENGIIIELDGLESETKHILTLRAENAAGLSPWSEEVTFSTTSDAESVIIVAEEEEAKEGDKEESKEGEKEESKIYVKIAHMGTDTGMFYGIFFTGGILIVAVVCMFVMRLV